MKLFIEFATAAAASPIVARSDADGLDGSADTALERESIDDVIAVVSLGKLDLAEPTSAVASLSILVSCDLRPLISSADVGTLSA
jgi:hypothetical protein